MSEHAAEIWDYNTMTAFCDYQHGYALLRSPYFLEQVLDYGSRYLIYWIK